MKGIERFVSDPLGMEFVPMRKEWIASAIGAAVGAASAIFGGATSANARRKAIDRESSVWARDFASNLRDQYQSVAERKGGQALLTRAKNFNMENWRKAKGEQAVSGGTAAATQLQKDAGNKMMSDTVANIGAMDDARYDKAREAQRQSDNAHSRAMMQFDLEKANNIAQTASGLSNAAMQLGGAFEKSTNLQGGSNNSAEVTKPVETPAAQPTVTAPNAVTQAAYQSGNTPTNAEWEHFRKAVSQ